MKVLMINGSPRSNGNTYTALHEMEKIFHEEGIETEILHIGNKDIRGCIACRKCHETGKCVFDDLVNETASKFERCDIQELDAATVNELIEKIVIHSPRKIDGRKHVTIEIYFTYAGKIRIPVQKPELPASTEKPA